MIDGIAEKRFTYEELWEDMYIKPLFDEYNIIHNKISETIKDLFKNNALCEYDMYANLNANQCYISLSKDLYEIVVSVTYSGIYLENLKDVEIECGISSYNGYTSYNTITIVKPHLDIVNTIIQSNISVICDYIDVLTRMNMNIQHCKMIYQNEVSKILDYNLSYEDNVRNLKLLFITKYLD